ncbi:MAG: CPBP family intramembrane metalloprotease [Lentimicrobiaceae bacterium]|nr:CPBP family intramembrane metalloprotease [Lentimicrobiaceae bacterium]
MFKHFFPPFQRLSHVRRIVLFLFVMLASTFFVFLTGLLIGVSFFGKEILHQLPAMSNPANPENIPLLKYLQIVSQVGMFVLPPLLFAFLVSFSPGKYLGFIRKPQLFTLVITVLLVLFSMPLINIFILLNESLQLPAFLKEVENWIIHSEKEANQLTEAFLNTSTPGGLMVNILMMALLPAIGEELVFRGAILRLLFDWTKNKHWAVCISAIVFSAFHLQFFGFLPRMLLGMLFGYLVLWSGSLWVAVFAHFINNIYAVITTYITNNAESPLNGSETIQDSMLTLISSGIVVIALLFIVFITEKRRDMAYNFSLPER